MRRFVAMLTIAISMIDAALAFGPAGHRIAGDLAEALLCAGTADEIAELGGGESLAELGLWADRIRGEDGWRHTGPWHYMNIPDDRRISAFEPPREGDVLSAIRQNAERLAQPGGGERRAHALKFLVHFIVDVHQPLHVGREADRGGNTVDVRFRGERSTLHRFWDSDVLTLSRVPVAELTRQLAPLAKMFARTERSSPADWAAESLALRPQVYAFQDRGRDGVVLDEAYLSVADLVTRIRLAQAAARLATTLNAALGEPGCEPPGIDLR